MALHFGPAATEVALRRRRLRYPSSKRDEEPTQPRSRSYNTEQLMAHTRSHRSATQNYTARSSLLSQSCRVPKSFTKTAFYLRSTTHCAPAVPTNPQPFPLFIPIVRGHGTAFSELYCGRMGLKRRSGLGKLSRTRPSGDHWRDHKKPPRNLEQLAREK